MNFERQFLAALDALIVALGGVVPVAATHNFQVAHLLRLVAIVQAVGGVLPLPSLNYHAAVLAHWRAAIAARGGVVPTVYSNFSQALLLHVQAFQATRGIGLLLTGLNFEQNILALVSAVLDADATAYIGAVQAAGGLVSNSASTLLSGALSATFNGLKYSDYKAKLRFLWVPLSDFAAIRVPLLGNNFTNVGFVSGAWNIASGLLGNGSASLTTPYTALDTPLNSVSMGAYMAEKNATQNEITMGSALNTFAFRAASAPTRDVHVFDCYNVTTGRTIAASTPISAPGWAVARRNGSAANTSFNGSVLASSSSSGGTRPAGNISLFRVPDFAEICRSRFSAFAYGEWLTDAEDTSLRLMMSYIHAGRALL